jgi:hypothetical protein
MNRRKRNLTRATKPFLSFLLLAGLLAPPTFAGTDRDPQELLSRSFQQADLWSQGPVKLVAKVRMRDASGQASDMEYTVSWAGPEKWRTEWSGPSGRQQITILNNGKLSYVTSQSSLLWSAIEIQATIAALDGGTPAGPYFLAPLDDKNSKPHVSKKKIDGIDGSCMTFGEPKTSLLAKGYRADLGEIFQPGTTTLCIDPASGHLLTAASDLGSFEYGNYTSVGSNSYPQTVKGSLGATPLEDAQVTVTRGEQFPDSLFAAPDKSKTVEFSSCADLATNFSAPALDKSVKAKMPKAAGKGSTYGQVWVLATVGKDGSVQKAKVLSGPSLLRTAATSAVQRYKYKPYLRCDQAVEFQEVVVVTFNPPAPPPSPSGTTDQTPQRPTYPTCFPCARS